MKTQVLRAVLLVGLVPAAFGQGTIHFANSNEGLVLGTTVGPVEHVVPLPAPGYVQAFAAPGGTDFAPWGRIGPISSWKAANPAFRPVGDPVPILPQAPGRFNGGSITISNTTPGGPVEVCLVAWYGNFTTFDDNYPWAGVSLPIHFDQTGNPLSMPPGVPVELWSGQGYKDAYSGLHMWLPASVVPEQGSLALAMLSAAAVFCRRATRRRLR